ncbi:ATP-binding protein [Hahella sp. SMD15-11]|uniref:histidine kinase n=1 Tax=Thermohahella caldifontis TaxID=3142973 RepID=A0AB39UU86_9GAMM
MARVSLRKRLRLVFITLASSLAILAFALVQGYRSALAQSWQTQADGHLLSLLAELEWTGQGFTLKDPVLDARMVQPGSGLMAAMRENGRIFWRSESTLGEPLPETVSFDAPPGEVRRSVESLGDQLYWVTRMLVQWQDDSGALHPLLIEVWLSQATYEAQLRSFYRDLAAGVGSVLILLLGIARVLSRFAFQPMSRLINEDLERVKSGVTSRLEGEYPEEVERLVEAFNQVLDQEQRRQQQMRHKLDDFAHSLKTPLAVLRGELARPEPDRAVMQQSLQRLDESVQYYLQRASASVQPAFGVRTPVATTVARLTGVLEKVYRDPPVRFECDIAPELTVAVAEGDLMEMLGNLLDNACKYGRGRVVVRADKTADGRLGITIEDNGPGIPERARGKVLRRGQRLDESAPGQGIGLAVVSELVHSYHGTIEVGQSETLGGARMRVVLPG